MRNLQLTHFNLNGHPIEIVKSYKYLGILLSDSSSLKPAYISTLANQVQKAMFSLLKKIRHLDVPERTIQLNEPKLRRPCQAGENLLPRLPPQQLSMSGLQLGSLSQQPQPPEELVSLLALTLSVTSAAPTFARTRKTPSSVKVLVECGTTGTALVFPDHNFRNLLSVTLHLFASTTLWPCKLPE